MRLIAYIVLVTLVCGIVYAAQTYFRDLLPSNASSSSSRPVVAEEATKIFAAGIVEGVQSPLALRFENPGKVNAIRVRAGESVKAGQVLAELEPASYKLRVERAEALLRLAISEQNRSVDGRPSTGSAHLRNSSHREDEPPLWPATHAGSETADARVASAEAALRLEQLQLENTRLVAPFDGTILNVSVQKGDVVVPSMDSSAVTIVDRSKTRVRAFVEEFDAMDVAVGQNATVVVSSKANREYEGRVVFCSPFIQPKSHRHFNPGERLDVRVREILIDVREGNDLLTGLPVEIFIAPTVHVGKSEHRSERVSQEKATGQRSAR